MSNDERGAMKIEKKIQLPLPSVVTWWAIGIGLNDAKLYQLRFNKRRLYLD